jgi:hypothetical protein
MTVILCVSYHNPLIPFISMELSFSSFCKRMLALALLSITIVSAFAFTDNTASAQGQVGVSISPATIETDEPLNPGTSYDFEISVKNLNETEQIYYLSTKDIIDVLEGGTPVFAEPGREKTGMELADWITLPASEIRLGAGVSERIKFTIAVPGDATPCSHFGSIFISAEPPEMQQQGAAVGYDVANIISVRVAGECNDSANIRQFSTKRFFNGSKNVDFNARIENTGNMLVRPVGPVEIFNMLGKRVDTFNFNENESAVLPKMSEKTDSGVREFNFTWTGEGTGFGRYEAILSPVYGENGAKKTMSSTVTFWILPINIILPALAGLAFLLLITFIFVRLYIRRTLAHLSHGQTRIVRKRKGKSMSATLLLIIVMLTVSALFMIILLALFA